MILKHPNHLGKKILIYNVRLSYQQYLQRRMFNQKRIINMLPSVNASNSTLIREQKKFAIMKSEVIG